MNINWDKMCMNLILDIVGIIFGSVSLNLYFTTNNTFVSYAAIIFCGTVAHRFLIRDNYS